MSKYFVLFAATIVTLTFFSFGFIDPNLSSSQNFLTDVVYKRSLFASILYVCIILILFFCYSKLLKHAAPRWIFLVLGLLIFSYPSFSYDIFNYILTAKVAYLYKENPYVVMPIEIPNEPMLAYTRAANKLALYGPSWIILTSIPFMLGMGNIATQIVSFKLFVFLFYGAMVYLIFKKTKRLDQAMFFALNPLVFVETLVSGHNDIVMMALSIGGLVLLKKNKLFGLNFHGKH